MKRRNTKIFGFSRFLLDRDIVVSYALRLLDENTVLQRRGGFLHIDRILAHQQ
jgi:hypothetical protein